MTRTPAPGARAHLDLDPQVVRRARSLARRAGRPVVRLAQEHTTVSVERATLRLAGLADADHERVPWVNHLVAGVRDQVGLEGDGRVELLRHDGTELATAYGEVGVAEVVGLRREDLGDAVGPAAQAVGARGVGVADALGERVAQGDVAVEGHRSIVATPARGAETEATGHVVGPARMP